MMQIKPAEPKAIDQVIERMRIFDQTILEEVGDPKVPMREAIRKSGSLWIGIIEDEAIVLCGLYTPSLLDGNAYIWLVTTPEVEKHQFTFVRQTQIFIKRISQDYRVIHGLVDIRYERSIKWLKWLGFEMGRPREFARNRWCIPFSMKGGQWTQ